MAKSAQQIIRESVRRVLREAAPAAAPAPKLLPGDKLKQAIFGDVKGGAPSDFYGEAAESLSDPAVESFVFVFTPSADKKTISATVTAAGGASQMAADDLQKKLNVGDPENSVPPLLSKLTPDMWADVGAYYRYTLGAAVEITGGEMDLTKESRMISEKWMKIAGLLNEAADRNAAEAAVKKYLAGGHKDIKAAEQALATALAAAGFDDFEEIEELLSRHMEDSESLARDLVKLLPKKK